VVHVRVRYTNSIMYCEAAAIIVCIIKLFEHNWSTFAFIHTKLHNKLSYRKLHELVFVNYNLHLHIQRAFPTPEPSESDPVVALMDLSLHRHNEAI
jgi:hypothetical protein